jgi:hypothetical protein
VLEHPQELSFPFALVMSMAILGGAALESEREHRRVGHRSLDRPLESLRVRVAIG